jgi:putative transposase
VFIRVGGVLHYLWRAVDRHGVVLDILVQERRDGAAAKRFFRRLLKGLQYKSKRLIADGLRSYGVAQRALLPGVKHRTSRYLNNRAENPHRPTRRHLGDRKRGEGTAGVYAVPIGTARQAQDFLWAHAIIYGHFRPQRHRLSAGRYRRALVTALRVWRQETCAQQAA